MSNNGIDKPYIFPQSFIQDTRAHAFGEPDDWDEEQYGGFMSSAKNVLTSKPFLIGFVVLVLAGGSAAAYVIYKRKKKNA